MSTLDPERWKALSPHLDRALTLGTEERAAWLAELRLNDPALAADLGILLEEHQDLARAEFLGRSPAPPPIEPLREGHMLGPYTLVAPIGSGGMGAVWLAHRSDGRFERRVAVKFPSFALTDSSGQERFKREGKILGRLAHAHIADLVDAGVSPEGQPYLVIEYVDGEPIDGYCDRLKLGVEARVRLFLDVLAAVAHAHASLIVHRDLKPPNVLVGRDGVVKLLDFGIAKLLESEEGGEARTQLTREGAGAMTPEYAAPEQVLGRAVTTATDVYSLGVLLYLLLTGEHPAGPNRRSAAELIKSIVDIDPVKPSEAVRLSANAGPTAARRDSTPEKLRRLLQGDLDTIIAKALKKDPKDRYVSVTALAEDLRRYLGHEPIAARPDTLAYRTAKFVRRNRTAVALASLAVLGPAALAVALAFQARSLTQERDRAERVSEFLIGLFEVSDPNRGRGNAVTAREVLDRGSSRLDNELKDEPEVLSSLLATIGRVYLRLGLYRKSEDLLARSGDIREKLLGREDPLTLQSRFLQANAIMHQGAAKEAEKRHRGVLAARRRVLGDEHLDTIASLDAVAVTLSHQERHVEAEPLYREVMEKRRRLLGAESEETIKAVNNLGDNVTRQGKFAEAEKHLREAAATSGRLLGKDHPLALMARANLVVAIAEQGRFAEAEALQREVLESRRRVLGKDSMATIMSETELARLLGKNKRYDEAEKLYQEALEDQRRVLGPLNVYTLATMYNMASTVYWDHGKLDEADRILRETYDLARRANDVDHMGRSSYTLGCLAAVLGHGREALDWLHKSLDVGFQDVAGMDWDPDLTSLQGNPEFERMIAEARKRPVKPPSGHP